MLGSRWVPGRPGGQLAAQPEVISRGGNTYARLVLGISLRDATGGYRAFRAATLKELALETVESQGYCFQVDLARRAVEPGFTVTEVPITFVEREAGVSKMSRGIVGEALWRVTVWGAQTRWSQARSFGQKTMGRKAPGREG